MAFMPIKRLGTGASEPRWRCVYLHHGSDPLDPPNTRMWRDLSGRPKAGSPLIVIPTASSVPPCSELSRYGLARAEGVERLVRRPTLTAPARVGFCNNAGRGEETGFQIERRNRSRKQEREIAALKPLDNEKPIQAMVVNVAEKSEEDFDRYD